MKSVLREIAKKNPIKHFYPKKKTIFILLLLSSSFAVSVFAYTSTKTKPNDEITLLDSNSTTIYQNKNPNFTVNFGKRDNPEQQWIRFESKNSKSNPFDKSKTSFWQKIKNFFSPIKSYGVEMSLRGVNVSETEKLENNSEDIKKVSEILGDSEVKTTTKLIELGRELGGSEDISKKTIVNENIANSVDLEYQIIKGKGLKEEIVIKNLDGYTHECKDDISKCKLPPNEFIFDMKLDEGLSLKKGWFTVGKRSFETYYFEDNRGKYVSHFLPSFAVDKAGGKTYDVILDVEEVSGNEYKVKVSVDIDWLFSSDRVFPVRIDPSIVHDSKDDFDTGIYNWTEYAQSSAGVQLVGLDTPVVDSNTIGYWNLNNIGFFDTSGHSNNISKTLNGIKYGVQHTNLSFVLNQYNGTANPGKIDIVCPNNNDSVCNIVDLEGNLYTNLTINSGINISGGATGLAYIMYSPSLSGQSITLGAGNSTNFILVRYSGSSWQYNNGATWVNFTPNTNNFIVAQVTLLTSVTTLDIWPSLADGVQYKGVKFDGVNDNLRLEDATKADIVGDISVEFWIKLTKAEVQTIVHKDTQYSIRIRENGYITWGDSSNWSYAQFGDHDIGLKLGEWKHVVVTKSGGVVKIYADGVEKVSKAFGGNITSTSRILHIGCYADVYNKCSATSPTYSSVYLDELKISNVARTPDDIYKSYLYGKEKFSGEYISTTFDSGSSISQVNLSSNVVGQMTDNGETPYSTTGLVAKWDFNERSGTVANSGGSCGSACNGTLNNFSNTAGQDKVPNSGWTYNNRRWGGGALMFDGVDDHVVVNHNSNLNFFDSITIESWFKLSRDTTYYTSGGTGVENGFAFILDKADTYAFGIVNNSLCLHTSGTWVFSDVPLDFGKWYHAVATYDGVTKKIYLNGNKIFEEVGSGFIQTNNNIGIGASKDGNYRFNGIIDSVRLYSRALTQSEISSNYNSNSVMYAVRGGNSNNPNDGTWSEWKENTVGSTLKSFDNRYLYNEKESGLVGYWSMDEESSNTINDISGNGNNGTATGTTIANGNFGKARNFNGTVNDKITIANTPNIDINGSGSKISIDFWFKTTSPHRDAGVWQTIFHKNTGESDCNSANCPDRQYAMFLNGTGFLHFVSTSADNIANGVGTTVVNSPVETILPNVWYHIVGVIDSVTGFMKLYVNGIEVASNVYSTAGIRQASGNLTIGSNMLAGVFFGAIDEFKIYNQALSSDTIQSEYLQGLSKKNTISRNTSNIYATKDNTLDDGLVSHWKMDEESGNEVKDSFGGNNGNAIGATIVDGKYGKGRNFDGSTQHIEIQNAPNLDIHGTGSQVTMSVWFNTSSLSAHQTLIFKGDGNTDSTTGIYSNRQYALFLLMDGSLHLSATSVNNVGINETVLNTANYMSPILPNTWNHVVAVIDSLNGSMSIYVNGEFICKGPFSNTGIRQGNGNLYFGLNSTNYNQIFPYSGILDDAKIFNIAKTSDEILRMYNGELEYRSHRIDSTKNDGLISYWKLDEESGNQVNDSVGNNNTTATGTMVITGKISNAKSFNSTTDTIPLNLQNRPTNTFTVSTWFKTSETHEIDPEVQTITGNCTGTTDCTGTSGQKYIFWSKWNDSPDGSASSLISVGTNGISVYEHAGGYMPALAVYDGTVPANTWNHLAVVYKNKQPSIYLNGVLVRTGQLSTKSSVYTPFAMGGGGYGYSQGGLDEVKIYNTAKTSDDIFEEYASLKDSFEKRDIGIVGYWSMNEATGNISRDTIYGFNGTATGTTIVNGISERARSFNGTGDSIALSSGTQANIVGDITISTWVNIESGSTNPHTIVHKNSQYSIRINTDGKITWGDSSNFSYAVFGSHDIGLKFNTWQHITLTKTGGVVKIYLNGVEKASVTFGGALTSKTGVMHIGCYSNDTACAAYYLKGMIDEVKIYNRALSASEVANAYRYSVGSGSYSKSTYVNYTFPQNNLSNKVSLPIYLASENVKESIPVTIGESAYANYQPDQHTVGLWHFDETDGTNAYIKDSSGYGNDGLPIGSTYIPDGKIGGARTFSSSNTDYIAINNSSNLNPSTITLEAWIKPKLTGNLYNVINKGNNTGYRIQLGSDGIVQFIDRGTTNLLSSNTKVVPNQWSHIVATGDSTGLKIYINGVLDASKTTAYGGAVTESPLYIGRYGTNKYFFSGDIDEVRISNIARSADEIRQAYEVGLRTHNVEIEFGAELDSTNLISGNTDKSFTIDATKKGLRNKASNIYTGEKIIVKENEYIAQGIVSSINEDTGAVLVNSWDDVSTFPTGGFTTKANVFKWQKEYLPVKGRTLNTHLDTAKIFTLRLDDKYNNGSVWIDNSMASKYIEPVYPKNILLSSKYRYFQYKGVLTSTDTNISPIIRQVQLDYTPDGPTMEQVMRHGKWFSNNQKQNFWWVK